MTHCQNIGRPVHLVNLDPAAEKFEYEPSIGKKDTFLHREYGYESAAVSQRRWSVS